MTQNLTAYPVEAIVVSVLVENTEAIEQLAYLESRLQPDDAWGVDSLTQSLQQDTTHAIAVVNDAQQVLAYCLYSHVFDVVEILRIGTNPDNQRQGLAARLIKYLQQPMCQKQPLQVMSQSNKTTAIADLAIADLMRPDDIDIDSILLEVREDNIAAIALYQKLGFAVIHRRKNYYHDKMSGEHIDALIMQYMQPNSQ